MQYPVIYTIGHSNHGIDHLVNLLRRHEIECLVDIRSAPYSRYSPHFSKSSLEAHLRDAGIAYLYMGKTLGGRPDDESCCDDSGTVDFQRIATKPWYREGIAELVSKAREYRVAIMCSEEDPDQCHRNLLISDTLLRESRASVDHIRGDGRLETADLNPIQMSLEQRS